MARPFVLGVDCAIYYQPDANRTSNPPHTSIATALGGPPDGFTASDLLELSYTMDATLNMTGNTADLTSRASNRWTQTVQVRNDASADFSILWRPSDAYFVELLKRFRDGCPICLLILDGEIIWDSDHWEAYASGCYVGTPYLTTGLYGDFCVTNFSQPQPLDEGVTADITVQPTVGIVTPQYFSVDEAGNVTIYQ
jgi:hypothetical protein